MKYLQQNLKAIILGLILASGISYAAAAGVFTGPTCAPPNCNTDAPVNVGNVNQAKQAGLGLSSTPSGVTDALNILNLNLATLVVDGIINTDGAQINGGLILRDGSQADGRVLVSDAIGNATWKNLGSITQNCSVNITSNLGLLTANTGNNRTSIKLVNILEPGTYTFSGSGQSVDQGGGGISAYFYSSTLYPSGDIANPSVLTNLPIEIRPYVGVSDGSKPDEVYYNTAGSPIIYAVKRYGRPAPTNWSIPANTTVTITESKYLYAIVAQASENGFVYITGTKSGCGTNSPTASNVLKGILTISSPGSIGSTGTNAAPYTVTVTGAAVGELASVALPANYNTSSTANVCGASTASVSSANTVKVHFWNSYGGTPCVIPAGTYTVSVFSGSASGNPVGGFGWVDILTAAQKTSGTFTDDNYYFNHTSVRSPSKICTDAGYTTYTGACKGSGVSVPFNYEGSIAYNTSGGTNIACAYGNGAWRADKNTQIMCIK